MEDAAELSPMRYWTFEEMQDFLLDHDIVVAEGKDLDDNIGITGKGEELFKALLVLMAMEGKAEIGVIRGT